MASTPWFQSLAHCMDAALEGAFDDECLTLSLRELLSDERKNATALEQDMFDYGHELSDIEDDVLREIQDHMSPGTAVYDSGEKRAVSAGGGKTRVRGVPRKRRKIADIVDSRERTEARLKKLLKNFSRANKKLWAAAYDNRTIVPIKIRDFLTTDGKRNHNKKFPPTSKTIFWDSSKPRTMISEDNVLLVAAYPGFLKKKAHDIIYEALIAFGRLVEVSIRSAADKNGRDALESYVRSTFDGELSGVFQLVSLWKPLISNEETVAGPARDITKNVVNLNLAFDLLRKLKLVTQRIDDMYAINDPEQYRFLSQAKEAFKQKYAWYECLATVDPSFFHGRSIIYNRATPLHSDRRDPKQNLTPILTVGDYTSGTLHIPELGLDVAYTPGTLVLLRGGLLKHSVDFDGGQRISIAHFLHQYMLNELDDSIPPLADVRASSVS